MYEKLVPPPPPPRQNLVGVLAVHMQREGPYFGQAHVKWHLSQKQLVHAQASLPINVISSHSTLLTHLLNMHMTVLQPIQLDTLHARQWRIQRGFRGFVRTPSRPSVFKYPKKMEYFGLTETKLFHFHGICKKNVIKSVKRSPLLYTSGHLSRNHGPAPARLKNHDLTRL